MADLRLLQASWSLHLARWPFSIAESRRYCYGVLRSLDTLIGFLTVLLVLSLAVTMLTQMVTNFLQLRSRHLREGVLDVFRQLGWEFAGDGAEILARKVVRSKDAITREDLIEILLVLAQKNTDLKDKIAVLTPGFDPQTLLAHVRRTALELSVERPDLAAAVVRSAAFARSPLARSRRTRSSACSTPSRIACPRNSRCKAESWSRSSESR